MYLNIMSLISFRKWSDVCKEALNFILNEPNSINLTNMMSDKCSIYEYRDVLSRIDTLIALHKIDCLTLDSQVDDSGLSIGYSDPRSYIQLLTSGKMLIKLLTFFNKYDDEIEVTRCPVSPINLSYNESIRKVYRSLLQNGETDACYIYRDTWDPHHAHKIDIDSLKSVICKEYVFHVSIVDLEWNRHGYLFDLLYKFISMHTWRNSI